MMVLQMLWAGDAVNSPWFKSGQEIPDYRNSSDELGKFCRIFTFFYFYPRIQQNPDHFHHAWAG
jgi:hypothetical protein